MVWVVYLSLFNFALVHRDYRRADKLLQPARIKEVARQELVDQCRRELKRFNRLRATPNIVSATAEDTCLSMQADVFEERQKAVTERLEHERSRMVRKLVLFYIYFGIIFLILPPVILYLLLSALIRLFKSIKFVN